nr:hypothetical protein [Pyrinomonadaceae bacterium]
LLCFAFVNAQKKSAGKSVSSKPKETKIKLGTKNYAVKGSIFNEIKYLPPEKSKDVFYQFSDPKNKTLTISTVGYAIENNKVSASTFETIICPFDKIDKEKSYILEMENEAITNEKVYRMTLISKGQGADNLYFQRQFISIFTDEIQIVLVNNVTVFFKSKAEAEKWLKTFTK